MISPRARRYGATAIRGGAAVTLGTTSASAGATSNHERPRPPSAGHRARRSPPPRRSCCRHGPATARHRRAPARRTTAHAWGSFVQRARSRHGRPAVGSHPPPREPLGTSEGGNRPRSCARHPRDRRWSSPGHGNGTSRARRGRFRRRRGAATRASIWARAIRLSTAKGRVRLPEGGASWRPCVRRLAMTPRAGTLASAGSTTAARTGRRRRSGSTNAHAGRPRERSVRVSPTSAPAARTSLSRGTRTTQAARWSSRSAAAGT